MKNIRFHPDPDPAPVGGTTIKQLEAMIAEIKKELGERGLTADEKAALRSEIADLKKQLEDLKKPATPAETKKDDDSTPFWMKG